MSTKDARAKFLDAVKQRKIALERSLIAAPESSRATIIAQIKACVRLYGTLDRTGSPNRKQR